MRNIGNRIFGRQYVVQPKAEYAEFVQKLKNVMNAEDIRGTVLVATDDEIIWASGTRSKDINGETVSPVTVYSQGA